MKFISVMTREYAFITLLIFSAAILLSCASKDAEDPLEPAVAREASIPVQATETASDEDFDPALIRKTETEVAEVPKLKSDLPIRKEAQTAPKRLPEKSSSGSIDDLWFLVAEVSGNRVYNVYVDTGSIENAADGVESWSKLVFEDTQRDDDGLSYNEVHIESSIDCEGRTYAYNTSKFYNQIGQLVYHEDIEYNREDITPDTLSSYVADFVCGYDFETN